MNHSKTQPPVAQREWAKHLRHTVPGKATVTRYYDEDESHHIDILKSENAEGEVRATVGLMEISQGPPTEQAIFSEVLIDARGFHEELGQVLATTGFFIIKDRWRIRPGVVFETMVQRYLPDLNVKHIIFVAPFQFGSKLTRVSVSGKTLQPLLAVPISDQERDFARERGFEALEARWNATACDVLDIHRSGAV